MKQILIKYRLPKGEREDIKGLEDKRRGRSTLGRIEVDNLLCLGLQVVMMVLVVVVAMVVLMIILAHTVWTAFHLSSRDRDRWAAPRTCAGNASADS